MYEIEQIEKALQFESRFHNVGNAGVETIGGKGGECKKGSGIAKGTHRNSFITKILEKIYRAHPYSFINKIAGKNLGKNFL